MESIVYCWTILLVWANLSLSSSANSTFLQYVSSINTNGCYKSLLLTLFFCFRTVNLELFASTYSLYRQTLNVQASTKVTFLPVCFHCLVTLCQRLWFVSTILALYKFVCMYVYTYVCRKPAQQPNHDNKSRLRRNVCVCPIIIHKFMLVDSISVTTCPTTLQSKCHDLESGH